MNHFIFQTYIIVLPIVISAIQSYVVWMLKESKKERSANAEGTKALLMIKLIEYHDKYCGLGYIPMYVHNNVETLYNAYHKLGGNGTITKMKEEMDELDIKKGEH